MNDEQQIASMRDEIRWAASRIHTRRARALKICLHAAIGMLLATLIAIMGGLCGQLAESFRTHDSGAKVPIGTFLDIGFSAAVFGGLAAVAACILASTSSRSRAAERFADRLSLLSPRQRGELLASLDGDRLPDTRVIVLAMRQRTGVAREIVPAQLAEGRGDEASAAETAP